jgi:hypothetical protein
MSVYIKENCLSLLEKLLPQEDCYERMVDLKCSKINLKYNYDQFINYNQDIIFNYTDEECDFFIKLCNNIINNKISSMDLECCCVFRQDGIFFDKTKNIVIFNYR